jgi:hypothetical protein
MYSIEIASGGIKTGAKLQAILSLFQKSEMLKYWFY